MRSARDGPADQTKDIWEREAGETGKQYEAFTIYRDLPYGIPVPAYITDPKEIKAEAELRKPQRRGIRRVAEILHMKSHNSLGNWSTARMWVKRAEAYDAHIEAISRFERERNIQMATKAHVEIANKLLRKVTDRLNTMSPEEMDAGDLVKALDEAVKIQRVALGIPTEITDGTIKHTGKVEVEKTADMPDLSGLNDEELGQLEGLLKKLPAERPD